MLKAEILFQQISIIKKVMAGFPTHVRIRLWGGVLLGIVLGVVLGILMESWIYGIIIGIVAGIAFGSRWAKAGMNK
jgi:hypothetical protein